MKNKKEMLTKSEMYIEHLKEEVKEKIGKELDEENVICISIGILTGMMAASELFEIELTDESSNKLLKQYKHIHELLEKTTK